MRYGFRCKDCNSRFEIVAEFKDIIGMKPYCPWCKGNNTHRDYEAINFILNGSGFYKNDNKQEKK